jgi:hypothetical protein
MIATQLPNRQSFRPPESLRTALLCAIAALLGGLGWSGRSPLNYLALLYPFLYLHSRRRLDSLSAIFYYAAATWSVIPASHGFFRTGANPIQPLLIWISLVALSSTPWIALYNRRFLSLSAIASLILLAVPPLGLVVEAQEVVPVQA